MQARAIELSRFPMGGGFFYETQCPGPSQASRKGVAAKGPRPLVSIPEADFSLSLWSFELDAHACARPLRWRLEERLDTLGPNEVDYCILRKNEAFI